MTNDIKLLTAEDFQDLGFLQEANRQFFHPLGLALALHTNGDPKETMLLVEVWDYRDDPEGMFFAPVSTPVEKIRRVRADYVETLRKSKNALRKRLLPYSNEGIQPIGVDPKENV